MKFCKRSKMEPCKCVLCGRHVIVWATFDTIKTQIRYPHEPLHKRRPLHKLWNKDKSFRVVGTIDIVDKIV